MLSKHLRECLDETYTAIKKPILRGAPKEGERGRNNDKANATYRITDEQRNRIKKNVFTCLQIKSNRKGDLLEAILMSNITYIFTVK